MESSRPSVAWTREGYNEEDRRRLLSASFADVTVDVRGAVALFTAHGPSG